MPKAITYTNRLHPLQGGSLLTLGNTYEIIKSRGDVYYITHNGWQPHHDGLLVTGAELKQYFSWEGK